MPMLVMIRKPKIYTTKKRTGRNKSLDILQQTCYQQADIRIRSHGLLRFVDDKSVASW